MKKTHKELDKVNLPKICKNCPDMHIYKEYHFWRSAKYLREFSAMIRRNRILFSIAKRILIAKRRLF